MPTLKSYLKYSFLDLYIGLVPMTYLTHLKQLKYQMNIIT